MNNYLEVFNQQEVLGKDFKVYGTPEEPLFLAKDVAKWIEHTHTTRMLESIDEDEKLNGVIFHAGQNREMTFLTEDGLYEVLMQSRKPIAKQFKKEVKKILRDIRKNGGYIVNQDKLSDDELLERALFVAQKKINERNKEIEQQKKQIAELQPKANYTDMILDNKGLVTITQIAKDYGKSGTAMNNLLHSLGVQYKQGGQWLLYAKYQDKGYVHSKTVKIPRSDGTTSVKMNTNWTQKGRLFIYNLLKDNEIYPLIEM